jgi:hypothetical protein
MWNISKRKLFFFDSSHFILSQTLMHYNVHRFFYHLAIARFLLYRDNSTAMNSHFKFNSGTLKLENAKNFVRS